MTDETAEIKIKTENIIDWKIEEPNFTPKTTEWFWALAIFATAVIVFSVLLKNYLLIIIVILAAIIFYIGKNRKPELINFRLDNEGLHIDKKFYPYDNFESFWIFPAHNKELALHYKKHLMPLLIIPFHSVDELKIRKILNEFLPENKEQESLLDLLRKKFF
ncbi:MAG: hypothetical protein Q8P06_00305 [Candidatus Azambacteria bacterium]|nr:hypothetical protein [Candidatus Azambacteria bacterium]